MKTSSASASSPSITLRLRRSARGSRRVTATTKPAPRGADARVFHVVFRLPPAPAAEAESAWSLAESARRNAPDLSLQFMEIFFKIAAPHFERAFEVQVSEGAQALLASGARTPPGSAKPRLAA